MKAIVVILFALSFGSGIATAQPFQSVGLERHAGASAPFRQSITQSEARAARMDVVANNVEKIDANRDGVVTRGELRAYALSMRRHVLCT